MTRLNFLALLTLLLGGMAYAIIEWRYAQTTPGESIEKELTPDFIAEALKSNIYTQLGQLSHSVVADRMEHYAKLEVTHFELPNYILYPKNNVQSKKSSIKKPNYPWKLSAKEATLYKNNRVILNHRVHLAATDENSLIQEIHCKYLELDLNTNIISSDQTVMVQGKDFTMYGSGLIIDLNTKQMTLTEHVRTIYKKNNS
jgi:lipopolysaccharide export system protein LptC